MDHSERKHSEIGASSSSRWMACPASVIAQRGLPNKSSDYAKEGTCAHELAEYMIENEEFQKDNLIGLEFEGVKVTEEMVEYVSEYVNYAMKYINSEESPYDTFVEERFELPQIHKDMFGSNDFCAMGTENKELVVVDLKYGKGIEVQAENNTQLIIYALGAFHESDFIYDFETIKLVIIQPRVDNPIKEWVITREELLEWQERIKQAVEKVYSNNPEFKTGDHCRFCKAAPTCKALKSMTEEVTTMKFDAAPIDKEPILPKPNEMTKEQMVKVLTHHKVISEWFKSVESHAHAMAEKGEEIPGFKLVKKRSLRKITDEKKFIEDWKPLHGDKILRTQLQTLSVLDKLIGKDEMEEYTHKPDTGTQLVPVSDKRKAIEPKTTTDLLEESKEDYSNMDF